MRQGAEQHHFLLPDCGSDRSSYSELLKPVFPTMVGYTLKLLPEINLFSLILLLLGYFTTATGKEAIELLSPILGVHL